jgi:hypothetical protein
MNKGKGVDRGMFGGREKGYLLFLVIVPEILIQFCSSRHGCRVTFILCSSISHCSSLRFVESWPCGEKRERRAYHTLPHAFHSPSAPLVGVSLFPYSSIGESC